MWEEKFKTQLREYQQQGKQLIVTWDAGGDDQIISFSLNDNTKPNLDNEVYSNLVSYLIEEFDMPKNGENYNLGKGKFSLEEDNRIILEFDEYAYADLSESDNDIEAFNIPPTEATKVALTGFKTEELDFYGSIDFLKEISEDFQLSTGSTTIKISDKRILKLHQEIKEIALSKFKPPYDGSQINFSGTMDQKEIYFDSLYQVKYTIFEDNENEKIYLFE